MKLTFLFRIIIKEKLESFFEEEATAIKYKREQTKITLLCMYIQKVRKLSSL